MQTAEKIREMYLHCPSELLDRFDVIFEQKALVENRLKAIADVILIEGEFKESKIGDKIIRKLNPLLAEETKIRASLVNLNQHLERFLGSVEGMEDDDLSEFE